jgi:hypothetical protein
MTDDPRLDDAVDWLHQHSMGQVDEWLATGPFGAELGVEYGPPTIERINGAIILTQYLRFI